MKWSLDGRLTTFLQPSGRSNGLYFARDGRLLACADEHNQLWAIAPDGSHEVLVDKFDGKLLNGPNDLWVRPDGGLYFTDPFYKRPYWNRGPVEQQGQCVYYRSADGQTLPRVARRPAAAQWHHRHARRQDAVRGRHPRGQDVCLRHPSRRATWPTDGCSATWARTA